MSSINLLPPELTIGSSSLKLSRLLKKISLLLAFVIVLALLLFTGAVILFTAQTRVAKNVQKEVETQIIALKETEQRLVLIRDRLQKISKVLSTKSSNVQTIQDIDSQNLVTIKEADIDKNTSRIEIGTNSLKNYTEFLEKLVADESFTEIELTSFLYNPRTGYDSELNLTKK